MKTLFDFPFPADWTADDLADAVPRPLSQQFDIAMLHTGDGASRTPPTPALLHRDLHRSDLPPLFHIR